MAVQRGAHQIVLLLQPLGCEASGVAPVHFLSEVTVVPISQEGWALELGRSEAGQLQLVYK